MARDRPDKLQEIRDEIDRIDAGIVGLIAARGRQVSRAGTLKATPAEVPAPERVEAIIQRVRQIAVAEGADPDLVETVYRTMIGEFIRLEVQQVKTPGNQDRVK